MIKAHVSKMELAMFTSYDIHYYMTLRKLASWLQSHLKLHASFATSLSFLLKAEFPKSIQSSISYSE